ncbi:hypothetical protein FOCC_FOCC004122 [Frankliniella occidentalis]|nr:hypothetical protein FOCC_FOCC004122 [Frankliniella occidentalis]
MLPTIFGNELWPVPLWTHGAVRARLPGHGHGHHHPVLRAARRPVRLRHGQPQEGVAQRRTHARHGARLVLLGLPGGHARPARRPHRHPGHGRRLRPRQLHLAVLRRLHVPPLPQRLRDHRCHGDRVPVPRRVPAHQVQREDPVLDGGLLDVRDHPAARYAERFWQHWSVQPRGLRDGGGRAVLRHQLDAEPRAVVHLRGPDQPRHQHRLLRHGGPLPHQPARHGGRAVAHLRPRRRALRQPGLQLPHRHQLRPAHRPVRRPAVRVRGTLLATTEHWERRDRLISCQKCEVHSYSSKGRIVYYVSLELIFCRPLAVLLGL